MRKLEQMKTNFDKQISILKHFGFKGEVRVQAGLVIIGAFDKNSASIIRTAFKRARNSGTGVLTEVRGDEACAFVWIDDSTVLTKTEIRKVALAA